MFHPHLCWPQRLLHLHIAPCRQPGRDGPVVLLLSVGAKSSFNRPAIVWFPISVSNKSAMSLPRSESTTTSPAILLRHSENTNTNPAMLLRHSKSANTNTAILYPLSDNNNSTHPVTFFPISKKINIIPATWFSLPNNNSSPATSSPPLSQLRPYQQLALAHPLPPRVLHHQGVLQIPQVTGRARGLKAPHHHMHPSPSSYRRRTQQSRYQNHSLPPPLP